MTTLGWLQLGLFVALLVAITKPLGIYLWQVLDPARAGGKPFLAPVLGPVERLIYWVLRVDPRKEHNWKQYGVAMLLFSLVTAVFTYGIMRLQDYLPWHQYLDAAISRTPMTGHLAFNTALSFTTNTNWQSYGGESTMSYFTQMVGLASHNFMSAAVGIAIAAVLIRGIVRSESKTVGNFWVDLVRIHLYVLLPICLVFAVFLVSQGDGAELQALHRGEHAGPDAGGVGHAAGVADHRAGAGGLAGGHQDAGDQRRRFFQRQRGPSV